MKFIRKDILKLTVPILAEQTFLTIMGMINTIMAGNIGKEVISAVGMVDSLNNIFISFFSALAIGGTVVVAQYSGRNNVKKANESTKQALFAGVLLAAVVTIVLWVLKTPLIKMLYGSAEKGVIDAAYTYLGITLFTYPLIAVLLVANGILRGAGDMKTPMKITMTMNVINVFFTYIFIHGVNLDFVLLHIRFAGMGIAGAALGIATARVFGAAIALFVLMRGTKIIKLKKLTHFRFDKDILISIFNIGIPASVESLLFNGGRLVSQIYIVSLGTIALASNSISVSVSGMLNVPGAAFSIAATTVVGQYMGRRDSEGAEKSLLYLTKFSSACLLIVGLISMPLARNIAALYNPNKDIIELTSKVIKLNGIAAALWPVAFVLPAGLKGAGDAKYTMITSVMGMWVLRISLGYVLGIPMHMGLLGVWLAMYIDWVVRGAMYCMRIKNGRWKQKVVLKAA